jgi:hypothetical protein
MTTNSEGKKKNVLFSFDDDLLLDARKVLFANNMTLQQYITFVMHKLTMEDESAKDLLTKAVKFHEESLIVSKEGKEDLLKINPNNLYSFFERQEKEK